MASDLRSRVVHEITAAGPMTFDRYMELCLYDPESGFFGSGRGEPGNEADFVTSPETSRWFSTLVTGWALDVVGGSPAAAIDVGAGSGHLVSELSEVWGDIGPVYATERSRTARARLGASLPSVIVGEDLDAVTPTASAVVVGNEIMDNMPAALARATESGWVEVAVDTDGEALTLVDVSVREEVGDWCSDVFGDVTAGTVVSAQLAVQDWLTELIDRFDRLRCCLVDYSATATELSRRHPDQMVRAYRKHRAVASVLVDPGGTDLTVDVNIDGVARAVRAAGAQLHVTDQRTFLGQNGALDLVEELRVDEGHFASEGRIMEQLMVRSDRVGLEAVLDPAGFGGFSVFLITSDRRS